MPSPAMPVDAIGVGAVNSPEVQSVQIGGVAGRVPPAPLVGLRTARLCTRVVVLVFGGELMGVVSCGGKK